MYGSLTQSAGGRILKKSPKISPEKISQFWEYLEKCLNNLKLNTKEVQLRHETLVGSSGGKSHNLFCLKSYIQTDKQTVRLSC